MVGGLLEQFELCLKNHTFHQQDCGNSTTPFLSDLAKKLVDRSADLRER